MNIFGKVSAQFQEWAEKHPVMGMVFIVIVMVAMTVISGGNKEKNRRYCGEWKKKHHRK